LYVEGGSELLRREVLSILIVFLLGLLLLASCMPSTPVPSPEPSPSPEAPQPEAPQPSEDGPLPSPSERVPRITVEELYQKMERGENVLIVDTRADVESAFEEGHIEGAVPVTLSDILERRWVPSTDREIVLYCT
jgi:hypothetical protein